MTYYTEWYNDFNRHLVRSPSFDTLDDLYEYMENVGIAGTCIYCDE